MIRFALGVATFVIFFFFKKKKAALYCTRTMPVLIDCDLGGVCPHRYPSLFREAAARGIEISHWVIGEKGGREEDVRLADLHTSPLPPPPQMVQWEALSCCRRHSPSTVTCRRRTRVRYDTVTYSGAG